MTFASVYEMLTPLTTVRKQYFWDWLGGANLKSIWNKRDIDGAAFTYAMSNIKDEGFSILAPNTASHVAGAIDFNGIDCYSHLGSVFIIVVRFVNSVANHVLEVGFMDVGDSTGIFYQGRITTDTFYNLQTVGGGTTNTNTDVALDTAWHVAKGELNGTNAKLTMDGVLKVTSTVTIPNAKTEVSIRNRTHTSGAANKEIRIRYYEAYNT